MFFPRSRTAASSWPGRPSGSSYCQATAGQMPALPRAVGGSLDHAHHSSDGSGHSWRDRHHDWSSLAGAIRPMPPSVALRTRKRSLLRERERTKSPCGSNLRPSSQLVEWLPRKRGHIRCDGCALGGDTTTETIHCRRLTPQRLRQASASVGAARRGASSASRSSPCSRLRNLGCSQRGAGGPAAR